MSQSQQAAPDQVARIEAAGYTGYKIWKMGTRYMGHLLGPDFQEAAGNLWNWQDSYADALEALAVKAERNPITEGSR